MAIAYNYWLLGIPNHLFQMWAFILTILFFTGKLKVLQRKYSFVKSERTILGKIMGIIFL